MAKILTATQVKKLTHTSNAKNTAFCIDSTCRLYLICSKTSKIYKYRKKDRGYISIADHNLLSLAEARDKAKELYKNDELGLMLKSADTSKTVKEVFYEWLDVKIPPICDKTDKEYPKNYDKRRKAVNQVSKWFLKPLGNKLISDLNKKDVVDNSKGMSLTTAKKVMATIRDLLKFARARGLVQSYAFMLEIIEDINELYPKLAVTHRKAVIDKVRLKEIINLFKNSDVKPVIKNLFFFNLLTAQRPHQIRELSWDRVDLKSGFIYFDEKDNKTAIKARIPLSNQAKSILEIQNQNRIGGSDLVFSSEIYSPISRWALSEGTLMLSIKKLGIHDLHAHGFRSILSTFAIRETEVINGEKRAKFDKRIIDEVLLHTRGSDVDKAYFRDFNSDEHLRLLQWWADFLDEL
ncbi:tyrosine-type recombinase/integrase [Campylobacter hyointestinalis]|uniref:tyrosine-type recombinase/integrase n=1 Tax=Campylobacter hyointestinalis TaxID=198 RepID=UPI00072A79CD|nr:tyrosine-type recombinase/integrase [Campylobacter hyointestinalis]PPB63123.1 hypothetical protein CDQ72_01625 [Campylobacter hyointestinalis subsp. hyointestinalis]PPB65393.1 hypothetical protein CDQ73_01375 [Campylobacter hyointestinalis subsp. hyointestinalis]CUU71829.1 phage integrase family site specific recombinase [Campylobacter hyointestinalis subsp. hyointestinalis]